MARREVCESYVLDSLDIGVIVVDLHLCVERFSVGAAEVANLTPDDLGRPIAEIQSRFAGSKLRELVRETINTCETTTEEVQGPDGRWYSVRASPLVLAGEELDGAVVSFSDVTERRQAEDALQSQANVPDENPNAIIRVAGDGTILWGNRSSAHLLQSWGRQAGQRVPDRFRQVVVDVLDSGSGQEVEIECGERLLSFALAPLVDKGYVNFYGRDVTERRRAEEEVRDFGRFQSENPNPVLQVSKEGTLIFANAASQPTPDCG